MYFLFDFIIINFIIVILYVILFIINHQLYNILYFY
jgi:hypothetical protein